MIKRLLWCQIIVGCILLFIITGCSTVEESTPAPMISTTPSPLSAEISFEVTYDGKGCVVSGPAEVAAGNYQFILKNHTDEKIDLWVSILKDGKTYQDLLDRQGDPGKFMRKPGWAKHDPKIYQGWNEELGGDEITLMLFEVGEHAIYVGPLNKDSLWFCAPLIVVEAPPE